MTVCYWDADKTMRFFRMPMGAALAVVGESSASGCVEILYEHRSYLVFTRDLMSHLQTQVSESAPIETAIDTASEYRAEKPSFSSMESLII
jgi:hypothetical protein